MLQRVKTLVEKQSMFNYLHYLLLFTNNLVDLSLTWRSSFSQEYTNHVGNCIEPACSGAQGMAEGPSFCTF